MFDSFSQFCEMLELSSANACRVLSVNLIALSHRNQQFILHASKGRHQCITTIVCFPYPCLFGWKTIFNDGAAQFILVFVWMAGDGKSTFSIQRKGGILNLVWNLVTTVPPTCLDISK